jgi:hypothetical protein
LTWNEDGSLSLAEPYVKGLIHGTAMQYGSDGSIIGTYTLIHGTGFHIWRQVIADKSIFVTEIHSIRDGVPHGHEWFFTFPQQDLWQERYWHRGKLHGMERVWNSRGRLRRGYPKFYISDQVVSRRRYLNLARADGTLPPYQEQDDRPYRSFPPEIREILQIVHCRGEQESELW